MDPKARIRALVEQGNSVQVDVNIPLKRYFRSGMEMTKMAGVYEEENNFESAFILYFRYVDLFVEKIKEHPSYASHLPVDKAACSKKLKEVLPKAEMLKKTLEKKYQREYNEHVAHQKALEEVIKREKELKLEKERREREKERKEREEQQADKWNNIHISHNSETFGEHSSLGEILPAFPTKYLSEEEQPNNVEVAERVVPEASSIISPYVPARELKPSPPQSTPKINRDTKPLSLLSANHDLREGRLRTVMVPGQLMDKFLDLAFSNTFRNVETCGILAGKLALNKFIITHLLVPQQVGTADSCTTQHEEELFDQQDKYDLITLGWIHTHPSQTAFLSSVDLHTHCSYQLMMPEALAIVCAPKFKETGYFTLTSNHGLNFIANCRENGFHPHPTEPPLFQAAEHVLIDPSLTIQVLDLRR